MNDETISGFRFQACADACFMNERKFYSLPEVALPKGQPTIVSSSSAGQGRLTTFFKYIEISRIRVLFVYGDCLIDFYKYLLPLIRQPIVLITHNSDEHFSETHAVIVEDPRITRVFAQNATFTHKAVHPIPIGLANPWWEHGLSAHVYRAASVLLQNRRKDVYFNFSAGTHPTRIESINHLDSAGVTCPSNWIRKPQLEYISELGTHQFVYCPRGNGMDTHRFWEALYAGARPILLRESVLPVHLLYDPVILDGIEDLINFVFRVRSGQVDWDVRQIRSNDLLNFTFFSDKILDAKLKIMDDVSKN